MMEHEIREILKLNDKYKNKDHIISLLLKYDPDTQYELLGFVFSNLDEDDLINILEDGIYNLDSKFYNKFRDHQSKKNNEIINPPKVEEGSEQCRRCGSKKTRQFSIQSRSADEPTSIHISCCDCNNRWVL